MNNHQFKVGDPAIALKSGEAPNQPRKKGGMYTVTNVMFCPNEGKQLINIDNTPQSTNSGYIACDCRDKRHLNNGYAWTESKYFVHPDQLKAKEKEAVANEDYETASLMRDLQQEYV